tara:strand:+ start:3904 stop:4902 length:999 start_codon:yes stop_codon:yes gene_type:complete
MPLVQLDFPNPLNTSVQIGDVAYFSNPIDYGTTGNPLSGDQWESTTTPHLTSDQGDIIKIGVITTIIPWDGTVSSIICDMPQALFNLYFSNLIPGGCVQVPNSNPVTSGDCSNYIASNDASITVPQTQPSGQYQQDLYQGVSNAYLTKYFSWTFFFDNPSLSVNDYMIHHTAATPGYFDQVSIDDNWCLIDNTNPNYVAGYINYWFNLSEFRLVYQGTDYPFSTVDAMLAWLIGVEPNIGIFLGMSYPDFIDIVAVTPDLSWIAGGGDPISGTYSGGYIETCTQGSFIMFSKDNKVNLSSALGYYASATLRNDSPDKAELFNIGADIFESSK